jgi:hypothetical protein
MTIYVIFNLQYIIIMAVKYHMKFMFVLKSIYHTYTVTYSSGQLITQVYLMKIWSIFICIRSINSEDKYCT